MLETRLGYGEVDFQIGGLKGSGGNPVGGFPPQTDIIENLGGNFEKREPD